MKTAEFRTVWQRNLIQASLGAEGWRFQITESTWQPAVQIIEQ